jgi:hypothetical protein
MPGVPFVQPRPPPAAHEKMLSQSSEPVAHEPPPNEAPQVASLTSPSIWKMSSWTALAGADPSISATAPE